MHCKDKSVCFTKRLTTFSREMILLKNVLKSKLLYFILYNCFIPRLDAFVLPTGRIKTGKYVHSLRLHLSMHFAIYMYILPYTCTFYHIHVHFTIYMYILPYTCKNINCIIIGCPKYMYLLSHTCPNCRPNCYSKRLSCPS